MAEKSLEKENMTEQQVLEKLLAADDSIPEKTLFLRRLDLPIRVRGLTGKQVYRIQDQCTEQIKGKKGIITERLDEEAFNVSLIATATVSPDWGDARLMSKHKASSPEEVIKRILLAGELAALGDEVLEVSGFNTDLEAVKN